MRVSARRCGGPLWVAAGLLVCAVALTGRVAVAGAVPPPPPNPSDGDIAAAGGQVDASLGEVSGLINEVAAAEQQLQQLDAELARKREAVNKALVDLQTARTAADEAAAVVAGTQRELADAAAKVGAARAAFDRFALEAYTRPGANAMVNVLTGADPALALERAQLLSVASKAQQDALDRLRRAQVDQANRDSTARQAKRGADAAAAAAEQKKIEAQHAVAAVQAAQDQQLAARDALAQQRDSAQQRLDAARERVVGLQGQRDAYLAWDRQRRAEQAVAAAAAAAAAARTAANRDARDRAAQLGAGKRPHTQLDNSPPPRRSLPALPHLPSGDRAQLIETVVDRAMSQLGVTYSWGGGNEDGPTLGIHDGGVADSYGDFNKVGFDCSGLMIYAFAGVGISLPHYSGYQYNMGTRVPVAERERGDMLFWGPDGSEHVALYLGDGKMVEAPESGDVVKVSPVREGGIMPYAVRLIP
ncbi:NlpC/P60 family protein [Nocardia sp. CDC159]|uniref:NlpC/P60 family protein n=1 Tax=Nocardia pulmonis TaxID=2951408 RepID=A0A9X2EC91_9NOCA|nr:MULTISPECIES: NlpC/P60 family protein [Nocardia]MCM6775558.1 NlpC/P60 family protein [Nocardia pulmonis]MCM6787708.1 NlpC/P60 family protein [Nocardia sp. CDC159]